MPTELQLMSLPPGKIDKKILARLVAPTLIKQGESYFIYGNSHGKNWELTSLKEENVIVDINKLALLFPEPLIRHG